MFLPAVEVADRVRRCLIESFGTALNVFPGIPPRDREPRFAPFRSDFGGEFDLGIMGVGGVMYVDGVCGRSGGKVLIFIDGWELLAVVGRCSS